MVSKTKDECSIRSRPAKNKQHMEYVAQRVERQTVNLVVMGSNPIILPIDYTEVFPRSHKALKG